MPATPKADGAMPNATCESGWVRPEVPPDGAGLAGGTNGVRLADLTKNRPAMMTNRQIATLTTTSPFVTQDASRMPTTAMTPRTSTMIMAPTFTVDDSPNSEGGRPSRSPRYPDQPRETTDAPSRNSRMRSQPMIQAIGSPTVAYAYVYALPAVGTAEASSP